MYAQLNITQLLFKKLEFEIYFILSWLCSKVLGKKSYILFSNLQFGKDLIKFQIYILILKFCTNPYIFFHGNFELVLSAILYF